MENMFEIVLLDRDRFGNPNGKKNSYSSDSANDIYNFYMKHEENMRIKGAKKKSKNKVASSNPRNKKSKSSKKVSSDDSI